VGNLIGALFVQEGKGDAVKTRVNLEILFKRLRGKRLAWCGRIFEGLHHPRQSAPAHYTVDGITLKYIYMFG